MKDWVLLLTALVNLMTAIILLIKGSKKEKGTNKRGPRQRRR